MQDLINFELKIKNHEKTWLFAKQDLVALSAVESSISIFLPHKKEQPSSI